MKIRLLDLAEYVGDKKLVGAATALGRLAARRRKKLVAEYEGTEILARPTSAGSEVIVTTPGARVYYDTVGSDTVAWYRSELQAGLTTVSSTEALAAMLALGDTQTALHLLHGKSLTRYLIHRDVLFREPSQVDTARVLVMEYSAESLVVSAAVAFEDELYRVPLFSAAGAGDADHPYIAASCLPRAVLTVTGEFAVGSSSTVDRVLTASYGPVSLPFRVTGTVGPYVAGVLGGSLAVDVSGASAAVSATAAVQSATLSLVENVYSYSVVLSTTVVFDNGEFGDQPVWVFDGEPTALPFVPDGFVEHPYPGVADIDEWVVATRQNITDESSGSFTYSTGFGSVTVFALRTILSGELQGARASGTAVTLGTHGPAGWTEIAPPFSSVSREVGESVAISVLDGRGVLSGTFSGSYDIGADFTSDFPGLLYANPRGVTRRDLFVPGGGTLQGFRYYAGATLIAEWRLGASSVEERPANIEEVPSAAEFGGLYFQQFRDPQASGGSAAYTIERRLSANAGFVFPNFSLSFRPLFTGERVLYASNGSGAGVEVRVADTGLGSGFRSASSTLASIRVTAVAAIATVAAGATVSTQAARFSRFCTAIVAFIDTVGTGAGATYLTPLRRLIRRVVADTTLVPVYADFVAPAWVLWSMPAGWNVLVTSTASKAASATAAMRTVQGKVSYALEYTSAGQIVILEASKSDSELNSTYPT